jgi:hypothetical protein
MKKLIERIYARCEEVGTCLEWQGKLNGSGAMYIRNGRKKCLLIRRVLWEHKHGPLPEGHQASVSCGNPRCVKHLIAITHTQKNHRIAATGAWSTPAFKIASALARRRRAKLDAQTVAAIRASEGTGVEIARRLGVAPHNVYSVRSGATWRDYSNPFAGLMR